MRISDWSSDVCSSDLRTDIGEAVHHIAGAEREARQQDEGGVQRQPGGALFGSDLGHLPDSLQRWAVMRAGTTSTAPLSTTTALMAALDWVFMTRTTSPAAPSSRARPWTVSCLRSVFRLMTTRLFLATITGVCSSVLRMTCWARIGRRGVLPMGGGRPE